GTGRQELHSRSSPEQEGTQRPALVRRRKSLDGSAKASRQIRGHAGGEAPRAGSSIQRREVSRRKEPQGGALLPALRPVVSDRHRHEPWHRGQRQHRRGPAPPAPRRGGGGERPLVGT